MINPPYWLLLSTPSVSLDDKPTPPVFCWVIQQCLCVFIPKLKTEVSLLCYSIQEGTLEKLNKKELQAVDAIKKNPKYFFSYAKRLQKTTSTTPVLRDETGALLNDPKFKAELLKKQYNQKVFSNPECWYWRMYEEPRITSGTEIRIQQAKLHKTRYYWIIRRTRSLFGRTWRRDSC